MAKRFIFLIVALLTTFTACMTSVTPPSTACEQVDTGTLRMSGGIDAVMLACAEAKLTPAVGTLIVNTFGGDVEAGRAIGALIADRPRTLIIDTHCLSSCGNYFVPAAKRVVLRPRAVIGLHGTPDPLTHEINREKFPKYLDQQIERGEIPASERERLIEEVMKSNESSLAAEEDFAQRFSVPRGWRIYRDVGESTSFLTAYVSGTPRWKPTQFTSMMIVEAPFMRSCLPHVEFDFGVLQTSVFDAPDMRKTLRARKWYGSGDLICKPGTGQKEILP